MNTETKHVHEVYEAIASHFSSTRYKPWPRVDSYLKSQPAGSIGCDVGGGNGKYLGYPHVYMIGSDRSGELTKIAHNKSLKSSDDALQCDGLALCYHWASCDFAISIAVVHHFATRERRIQAIRALLGTVHAKGTILVYVWAIEQENSRRGYHPGMDPDVMVPWVNTQEHHKVYHRYYHLYTKGELEEDIREAGGNCLESGFEKDNWWCVAQPMADGR